ncbi:MAG: hypothetical protein A3F13_06960 [Gammaproteobacteria bacterium RIFCSPHIGHO2_12_FULL_40_19]|nr:MAG: hypothetical protein A3F13_06960 [Gammaproteobacteria bacterium RIFCSPHIGHO2_12_FULL_40_19]
MMPDNICPACRKAYDRKPTRCICGWYLTSENKIAIKSSNCQYIENGKQCDKFGSVSFVIRGEDWFCGRHAHMLRNQSFKR